MTTFAVDDGAHTVDVTAKSAYVESGALVLTDDEGDPVAIYAAGEWANARLKAEQTDAAASCSWQFLPAVPSGIYVVRDIKGDTWSSYGGQLYWRRDKDGADPNYVGYTGPFRRP